MVSCDSRCGYRGFRRFVILALAMAIGSRITIEIPRAKGHVSVSDTFVFLALLLFGGQAAVLLAATEALTSSRPATFVL